MTAPENLSHHLAHEPVGVGIHRAILAIMRAVPAVPKSDRNTQGKGYDFRGIDATLNAIGPALRDHGVVVCPELVEHGSADVLVGQNRTPMRMVTVLVRYRFVASDNSQIAVLVPGEAMDSGDKAYSKAMSVAFRTALLQTFALPTDERDPDADTYERAPAAQPQSESAPARKPKSEADIARDDLAAKCKALKYNKGDVAQMYLADMGTPIQEETDARKIADFTERLGPK